MFKDPVWESGMDLTVNDMLGLEDYLLGPARMADNYSYGVDYLPLKAIELSFDEQSRVLTVRINTICAKTKRGFPIEINYLDDRTSPFQGTISVPDNIQIEGCCLVLFAHVNDPDQNSRAAAARPFARSPKQKVTLKAEIFQNYQEYTTSPEPPGTSLYLGSYKLDLEGGVPKIEKVLQYPPLLRLDAMRDGNKYWYEWIEAGDTNNPLMNLLKELAQKLNTLENKVAPSCSETAFYYACAWLLSSWPQLSVRQLLDQANFTCVLWHRVQCRIAISNYSVPFPPIPNLSERAPYNWDPSTWLRDINARLSSTRIPVDVMATYENGESILILRERIPPSSLYVIVASEPAPILRNHLIEATIVLRNAPGGPREITYKQTPSINAQSTEFKLDAVPQMAECDQIKLRLFETNNQQQNLVFENTIAYMLAYTLN